MRLFYRYSLLLVTLLFAIQMLALPAVAGDAVPFSGKVKKVIAKKNKVGILNPENKKRFTVVIGKDSKLTGFAGIADLEKGDMVEGKYVVTDKGLYVVTEMSKK